MLKDKLNTHHNVRLDGKSGTKKATTKKANTKTSTIASKARSKSKPVSGLESGAALPRKTNSMASVTRNSAALYGQLRQADAKINGLLARSTQLALEARHLTTEHTKAQLHAHECELAQEKANFTSAATTEPTTKSAGPVITRMPKQLHSYAKTSTKPNKMSQPATRRRMNRLPSYAN